MCQVGLGRPVKGDAPPLQRDHPRCRRDGFGAVGDGDPGDGKPADGFVDLRLGHHIQVAGGFVQGQDIRVGTAADCNTLRRQSAAQRGIHEVVAVEDGVISSIGTYTVKLRGEGSIYNYMHLNMNRLAVTAGQFVKAGDLIGYVSNDFGGTPTTIHLHFEITQNTAGNGWVHVPPYLSLVQAYERRENGPGQQLEPEIGIASAPDWVIPEGYEIIE